MNWLNTLLMKAKLKYARKNHLMSRGKSKKTFQRTRDTRQSQQALQSQRARKSNLESKVYKIPRATQSH